MLDKITTTAYKLKGVRGDMEDVEDKCYYASGDLAVTFVLATLPLASPLVLTAIPVDDINFEPKSFNLGNAPVVEAGKWYAFSPAAVDVASGGFSIPAMTWGEGGIY